ncbi:MAG: N-acetylglucosamine-6-phosphate deacetylase, partial [Sphingomonas sp.]
MTATALIGAKLVLPDDAVTGHALLIERDRIVGVVAAGAVPSRYAIHDIGGGWLLPGFIDTQVNGGGD